MKVSYNTSFTPLILYNSFHLLLTTNSSSYKSAPLSFFLAPHLCLADFIHLCSLLFITKKLTYGTLPWLPHLHFAV